MMQPKRAYILCDFAHRTPLYTSWMSSCPVRCEVVERYSTEWEPPADATVVITHLHYRWEEISILRRLVERRRVPVLVLADGILEYRNTFEHAGLADGSVFHPVIGHKLACVGRSQARVVEAWGNRGKCEVVGLPRLDDYLTQETPPPRRDGPLRLLIATARTPYFDEQQRAVVLRSLQDLRSWCERVQVVSGRPIEMTWRLTGDLPEALGVPTESPVPDTLAATLGRVDAVVTTASTVQLEVALKDRPVAVLDYHNRPQFVPAAWTITAPAQLDSVIADLAAPPEPRMFFQRMVLHDSLECRTPATDRMHRLVERLSRYGVEAGRTGPLEIPANLLQNDRNGADDVAAASFYPENAAFQCEDVSRLQLELSHAVHRLGQLPAELRKANDDLRELRSRLAELRKRFAARADREARAGGHRPSRDAAPVRSGRDEE